MDSLGGFKRQRKRRHIGGSKFTDFISKANNFLKQHKVISTLGNTLGSMGVPYASKIGSIASSVGYGYKPVRRRRRMTGGANIGNILRRGNNFLKQSKLISNVAKALEQSGVAPKYSGAVGRYATSLGYGRKAPRRKKKKVLPMLYLPSAVKGGMGLTLPGGMIRRTRRRRRPLY